MPRSSMTAPVSGEATPTGFDRVNGNVQRQLQISVRGNEHAEGRSPANNVSVGESRPAAQFTPE